MSTAAAASASSAIPDPAALKKAAAANGNGSAHMDTDVPDDVNSDESDAEEEEDEDEAVEMDQDSDGEEEEEDKDDSKSVAPKAKAKAKGNINPGPFPRPPKMSPGLVAGAKTLLSAVAPKAPHKAKSVKSAPPTHTLRAKQTLAKRFRKQKAGLMHRTMPGTKRFFDMSAVPSSTESAKLWVQNYEARLISLITTYAAHFAHSRRQQTINLDDVQNAWRVITRGGAVYY